MQITIDVTSDNAETVAAFILALNEKKPNARSTAGVDTPKIVQEVPQAISPLPQSVPSPPAPSLDSPVVMGHADVDSEGIPWDARIHASTKTKTAKGTWTKKRGTGDTSAVEGELKAIMQVPAPAPQPRPFPPQQEQPADPLAAYMALISKVSTAISSGRITSQMVDGICQQHGVPQFNKLNLRLDLLPQIESALNMMIG